MTRHRESISVASLSPKEQAMKNTWVGSGSISAENMWWKKVVSSSLISKSHRRTCTFELFQSRSLLLNYLNLYYFDVSLWTVIVNYLDFGMSFVLFILSDVNIDKNLINWLYALLISPYIFYDESQCSVVLTSLLSKIFFIEYVIEPVLSHGFVTSFQRKEYLRFFMKYLPTKNVKN